MALFSSEQITVIRVFQKSITFPGVHMYMLTSAPPKSNLFQRHWLGIKGSRHVYMGIDSHLTLLIGG